MTIIEIWDNWSNVSAFTLGDTWCNTLHRVLVCMQDEFLYSRSERATLPSSIPTNVIKSISGGITLADVSYLAYESKVFNHKRP